MLRIVAYAQNGVQRFAVDRPEMLIGSDTGCDIHLPFSGVGAAHARLRAHGDGLEIEDLGTRKGVVVNGHRVRAAKLDVLDEIRLGSIALLVEDVVQATTVRESSGSFPAPAPPRIDGPRMIEHLARVSQWVLADSASATTLESLALEILRDFGGGVLFLFQGEGGQQAVKFVVASHARWLGNGQEILDQIRALVGDQPGPGPAVSFDGTLDGEPAWVAYRNIRALDRPYLFAFVCRQFREQGWSPLAALQILANQLILGLVHHVGQYEPILFGRRERAGLTLAPGFLVGESQRMERALERLRSAIDPPVQVLLRGEPGTGKEQLARSLHLSGARAAGPFVVASGRGAKPVQVEADLFGAEIPGKHGPVVREGKLVQADGGTLYLQDVEQLPLELQDRLVRFLRSGEIEAGDGSAVRKVDVRLIAASLGPLEPAVARDLFRIDLAHRLSQLAIDVPSLRSRREDLPLLIQAAVNRCCHQTGKRIHGITVKAMEALTRYDFPGNLLELENIVRQLVYLCPSGRPIDDAMLPPAVRLAELHGPPVESLSELHLERLVADCERAAILEGLRRSDGNKSEAARQLGLSRNGLAMKMERLGLKA